MTLTVGTSLPSQGSNDRGKTVAKQSRRNRNQICKRRERKNEKGAKGDNEEQFERRRETGQLKDNYDKESAGSPQ